MGLATQNRWAGTLALTDKLVVDVVVVAVATGAVNMVNAQTTGAGLADIRRILGGTD